MSLERGYKTLINGLAGRDNKRVFVVHGAPGSGKSHWVKQHAKTNDLIVDLDEICAALSSDKNIHGNHDGVLGIAIDVRDYIYQRITNRDGKWTDAYVVTASKNQNEVGKICRDLGAEMVKINPGLEACIANIKADASRIGKVDKYVELAKEWHEVME